MAPNGAGRIFVPTNQDLANILGTTDLDFEHLYFFHVLDPKFLDFQVPKIWISRLPKNPHSGRGAGGRTTQASILDFSEAGFRPITNIERPFSDGRTIFAH